MSRRPLEIVYCDDEALAIRCHADYRVLTPSSNMLASGADGAFAEGEPWTLRSASVDFEAQGVKPGMIVVLDQGGAAGARHIKGSGDHLAVASVEGSALGLRRIGLEAGVGQPPAPPEGLEGVRFSIATLAPQIEQASDDINRRFGIDPARASRAPEWIYDRRELEEATMLAVLLRQYSVDARASEGDFPLKVREVRRSLDECLARLRVRWGPSGDAAPPSTKFGTRLVRG